MEKQILHCNVLSGLRGRRSFRHICTCTRFDNRIRSYVQQHSGNRLIDIAMLAAVLRRKADTACGIRSPSEWKKWFNQSLLFRPPPPFRYLIIRIFGTSGGSWNYGKALKTEDAAPHWSNERTPEWCAYAHFQIHRLTFINSDVSVGRDQILRRISARLHKLEPSEEGGEMLDHARAAPAQTDRVRVRWLYGI